MRKFWFLLLILISLRTSSPLNAESPVIGAYYQNYSHYRPITGQRKPFSLTTIPQGLLTDLYFAFGTFGYITKSIDPKNPRLTGDFKLQPTEPNDEGVYLELKNLKQKQPELNIFLSLGGWNFNNPLDPQGNGQQTSSLFSRMISQKDNRQQFIQSAVAYAHLNGFDGIDLDWEYPGDLTRGGREEDFPLWIEFLRECHQAFQSAEKPLLLSLTTPASLPKGLPPQFQEKPELFYQWLAACSEHVDRLNIMGYDYHGPFDEPKITGVNAPLTRDTLPNSPLFIIQTLENYLKGGVPTDKIILGIPSFGRSFGGVTFKEDTFGPGLPFHRPGAPGPSTKESGLLAYYEITDMIASRLFHFAPDTLTQTAFGYSRQRQEWISFDTPETIALKAQVAQKHGLKGVILWSLDMDEYQWEPRFPNLRSARKAFYP